jgi:hypothetical protein
MKKNCTKMKVNSSWKNPLVGCEVSRREGWGERERERGHHLDSILFETN